MLVTVCGGQESRLGIDALGSNSLFRSVSIVKTRTIYAPEAMRPALLRSKARETIRFVSGSVRSTRIHKQLEDADGRDRRIWCATSACKSRWVHVSILSVFEDNKPTIGS